MFEDLDTIDKISVECISKMKIDNIGQWEIDYPRKKHFKTDIEQDILYVYEIDQKVKGVIAIDKTFAESYRELASWSTEKGLVLHRIMVSSSARGLGIAKKMFNFAIELAKEKKYSSIKIDTHTENFIMLNLIEKYHFEYRGYLKSINRSAYELLIHK